MPAIFSSSVMPFLKSGYTSHEFAEVLFAKATKMHHGEGKFYNEHACLLDASLMFSGSGFFFFFLGDPMLTRSLESSS
jgi:hypothetical protein